MHCYQTLAATTLVARIIETLPHGAKALPAAAVADWMESEGIAIGDVLEAEVPDPCERITAHGRAQQPPQVASQNQQDQAYQRSRRAGKVKAPAGAVLVLAQVVRIELGEAGKSPGHHHSRAWINLRNAILPESHVTSNRSGLRP